MNYIVLTSWLLILHHEALLQSSSNAENLLAATDRVFNAQNCADLCRDVNLRKRHVLRQQTLPMLYLLPIRIKLAKRSNYHDYPGYNLNTLQDIVMDYLCDCADYIFTDSRANK